MVKTASILPYHQLMTPKWLSKHATIFGSHTLNPKYLQINPGVNKQHDLQVQLVAPGILTDKDCQCVSVKITVAMDTAFADSRDHDPIFGISDDEKFIGFYAVDKSHYTGAPPYYGVPPCFRIEGDNINNVLTNYITDRNGPRPKIAESFSSEIKIQIKPCELWGSCHTEHNGGHVLITNYNRTLDLTKGLYFDMYRDSARESFRIKYISVDVELD